MVWCSSGFILLICLRQPSLTHSDRPFNSAWSRKLLVRRASTSKDCIFQRGLSTWQTVQTSKSAVTHRCNRPVLFPRRPEVQAHMVPFAAPGQISGVGILLPGCAFTAFGLWAPTVCFSLSMTKTAPEGCGEDSIIQKAFSLLLLTVPSLLFPLIFCCSVYVS